MEAKGETAVADILSKINRKEFKPVYILMGVENYFIDFICDKIVDSALTEEEKDFNYTLTYGLDTNVRELIATCRRFPMMSKYQLVVVKEAQLMDQPDVLSNYLNKPTPSTILVVCCKNGNLKAPETLKLAKKSDSALVFESTEMKENAVGRVITSYITGRGYKIDPKAVMMLKDYVGTDVSRMIGETDKLMIVAQDTKYITPEMIETNIGISKDYNNFELEAAIKERNMAKAMQIVMYFQKNSKNNPTVLTAQMLFSFFSNLLLILTSRDRSESVLMERIGTKSQFRLRKIMEGARYYSAMSCFNCIGFIRDFDRKCKGIDSRQNEYELMKELVFKIINS